MKNKKWIIVGILCIAIFGSIGCSRKEENSTKKESGPVSTSAADATTSPVPSLVPVVEKGNIYAKREKNEWQGVYSGQEKGEMLYVDTLYIHRVTEDEIWFSFEEKNEELNDRTGLNYLYGTKKANNYYEFHYEDWSIEDGTFTWDGEIERKGDKVLLKIRFENDKESESSYVLEKKNGVKSADSSNSVIELARCLNKSYSEVKQQISTKKASVFNIGKEQGTDKISYIEVGVERDAELDKNLGYFQIKGIGIWCSKEECKKILEPPTEEYTYDLRYRTEDGYEICFTFYKNHVQKMGIYLGSKKEAMKKLRT